MARIAHRGRVALALGGGSARGLAHIGVLRVLDRELLRPALVTGTSMGALIRALYCAGHAATDIERVALDVVEPRRLLYLAGPRPSRAAMFDFRGLAGLLNDLLPSEFADLELPFACVSVDLTSAQRVVHTHGNLVRAIQASCSVPVAFAPVADEEAVLVDGGVIEPVPIDTARALGARRVVAVTVSTVAHQARIGTHHRTRKPRSALPDPGGRWRIAIEALDIMQRRLAEVELQHADLVIAPHVDPYTQLSFTDGAALIALGEAAAAEAARGLRSLLG